MSCVGKTVFSLSYPPSVNKLYATYNGRRLLTRSAKEYKNASFLTLRTRGMLPDEPVYTENVCVHILLTPPDRRRRDSDNILKITFDTLVYCRMLKDDSLIKEHAVFLAEPDKDNAGIRVVISPHSFTESLERYYMISGVDDV